jgi:5-methylthioribose kinase
MEITPENCAGYLEGRGERVREVRELGGGVSNRVLLVHGPDGRYVLKQSLDRLRVADEWLADRSRIFRERQSLEDAARLLPAGAVPRVLWSDEANFLFAMAAAPPEARTWKSDLLAGRVDPAVAATVGTLLGLLIRGSWGSAELECRYGDQTAFDQLRIDPYYRTIARRRPEVAGRVQKLIAQSGARRVCLVHGDWSPKNVLVWDGGVTMIDFEVVHYGDPTFDAAFCLNHFLLKCFHRPESAEHYLETARVFWTWLAGLLPCEGLAWFEAATVRHLGCLMLARIDGKSPVEYLTEDRVRQAVRDAALRIIQEGLPDLESCYNAARERLASL